MKLSINTILNGIDVVASMIVEARFDIHNGTMPEVWPEELEEVLTDLRSHLY